jgi:hypothetical protein
MLLPIFERSTPNAFVECCGQSHRKLLTDRVSEVRHNSCYRVLRKCHDVHTVRRSLWNDMPTEHVHKDDLRSDDFQDDFQQLFS